MVTENRSLKVVWKNVRKMRSRERQSEIMDWIERSNCDVCAVNETGVAVSGQMGGLFVQDSSLKKRFDVRK